MAKVSHSSNLTKCRNCGAALDVFVPKNIRFCTPECEAVFTDRPSDRDWAQPRNMSDLELQERYSRATK